MGWIVINGFQGLPKEIVFNSVHVCYLTKTKLNLKRRQGQDKDNLCPGICALNYEFEGVKMAKHWQNMQPIKQNMQPMDRCTNLGQEQLLLQKWNSSKLKVALWQINIPLIKTIEI